ncbi:MAG: hypothetical protein HY976_03400, partial [Candidatus Kerfeldbacteria bacterium]|nr:hypothetical protein [Candidatus Kerfeldbacteria bacterium]
EKGFWAAIGLGALYLLGEVFKTEDSKKLGGKAVRVGGQALSEVKDTLFDEDGEVGDFGRAASRSVSRHALGSIRGLKRERAYRRQQSGVLGFLRDLFDPTPRFVRTMSEANRKKRPRR